MALRSAGHANMESMDRQCWRAIHSQKRVNSGVQIYGGNSSMFSKDSFRNEGLNHLFSGSATSRQMSSAVSFLPGLPLLKWVFLGGCLHSQTNQHGGLKAQYSCPNLGQLWMVFTVSNLPAGTPEVSGEIASQLSFSLCSVLFLSLPSPSLPTSFLPQLWLQEFSLIRHLRGHLHLHPGNSACDRYSLEG